VAKDWKVRGEGLLPTAPPAEVVAKAVNEAEETIPEEDIAFVPTRDQRKAKAMAYAMAKSKGLTIRELSDAESLIPSCRPLRAWWHNDLFVEWFLNTNTYMQRIDYLIDLQLDNLEEIITNVDGTYSARDKVVAGKQLAEYKKTFIDEDKAAKGDSGVDMIKALAVKMLEARKAAALNPAPESDECKVELPT